MPSRLMDPEYWRERAEEARAQASKMTSSDAKLFLLNIARNYDALAEQQQRMVSNGDKPGR